MGPTVRLRGLSYRYWPVLLTVSMARLDSVPLPPETNVRMYTIRSPSCRDAGQSSGLVVFGRSWFS
jgi:hypothetical protein